MKIMQWLAIVLTATAFAADNPKVNKPATRAMLPPQTNVAYGEHERQVLDLLSAE